MSNVRPRLEPVVSTNIQGIGWDRATGTLHVAFKSGKVYVYPSVTVEDFEAFRNGDSLGMSLNKIIKVKYGGVLCDFTAADCAWRDKRSLRELLPGAAFGL